jgi:hypothetical protein
VGDSFYLALEKDTEEPYLAGKSNCSSNLSWWWKSSAMQKHLAGTVHSDGWTNQQHGLLEILQMILKMFPFHSDTHVWNTWPRKVLGIEPCDGTTRLKCSTILFFFFFFVDPKRLGKCQLGFFRVIRSPRFGERLLEPDEQAFSDLKEIQTPDRGEEHGFVVDTADDPRNRLREKRCLSKKKKKKKKHVCRRAVFSCFTWQISIFISKLSKLSILHTLESFRPFSKTRASQNTLEWPKWLNNSARFQSLVGWSFQFDIRWVNHLRERIGVSPRKSQ